MTSVDFNIGDTVRFKPEFQEKMGADAWVIAGCVAYDGSYYSKGYKQVACDPRMIELVHKKK